MGQSVTPVAREARLLALSIDLLGAAGFDGYLKLHNPAWSRTLGYDDHELATTPYIELIHPDDQPAARAVIDRMANGGTTIEFVCRIRRRDGMWRHILWSGQGAPDDGCFYIVGKDVTERRRLDQELENRAERMKLLIDDLLRYSRVGSVEAQRVPVDADAVLENVLRSLDGAILERGATVVHEPLGTVQGDATQIGQLLQNLVANAIKFARDDVPAEVRVERIPELRDWHIVVRDNGIGIEERDAERIFKMFGRLH